MPTAVPISQFRETLSDFFREAVQHHRPVPIERSRRDRGVLLGQDDVLRLLEVHEFHPEVLEEEGAVSIWLPELALYGRGAGFTEAREDLLAEVRDYVEDYLANADLFLHAPNRAHHFPYVLKALIADLRGELAEVLFWEAPASNEPTERAQPVPPEVPGLPAWLFQKLVTVVGIPEDEVLGLSEQEARERLNEFYARPRRA